MQYYSKSPKQLQKEREVTSEKSERKFSRGRAILLIDVVLVLLIILFYQSSLRDVFSSRQGAMKNFQWKSFSVEAGCQEEGRCRIELTGDELSRISTMKWQLKTKENQLLIEQTQILEHAEVSGREILTGFYQIPDEYAGAQLYVQLFDESLKEQITFRVYP